MSNQDKSRGVGPGSTKDNTQGKAQDTVLMSHGSGGTMMKRLIEEVFYEAFSNQTLLRGDDAARVGMDSNMVSISTDSFVVTPHFFPGGDIGRLAICGTVNDVATVGARPKFITCGFILEEGFPLEDLRRICQSMASAAEEAQVRIITGDTKVVERGHGDGIYINTTGIGAAWNWAKFSGADCRPGDKILLSGTLGDHGIAIISQREGLSFQTDIVSDAAPLAEMVLNCARAERNIRCFRDPTRGGLASTLNELAGQSGVTMTVWEDAVPVKDQVRGACDMLGYDVFQVANEGKMVCIVPPEGADAALEAMRQSPYGQDAAIIGEVTGWAADEPDLPPVRIQTAFGSYRVMDMLVGEQLPRIC